MPAEGPDIAPDTARTDRPAKLRLGGFVPLSTVDWPGELAATVFLRGCPWNCPYCHNPHLISAVEPGDGSPTWPEVLAFLESRRGLLDGVVFTGGEPTAQSSLAVAMHQVKEMGFAVALHSGGPIPDRFAAALKNADWVGFDVKAPLHLYDSITRCSGAGSRAFESLRLLIESGVPFEARTTVHPSLLTRDDLALLADELEALGVRRWVIQRYRGEGVREGELPTAALGPADLPPGIEDRFDFVVR